MDISLQRILHLMEVKKINGSQLHEACNLNNSAITKWKKNIAKPSTEAIVSIADFFNVSTDYLLGRTDNPHPVDYIPKNAIPYEVLKQWEFLSPNEIKMISNMINSLVSDRVK